MTEADASSDDEVGETEANDLGASVDDPDDDDNSGESDAEPKTLGETGTHSTKSHGAEDRMLRRICNAARQGGPLVTEDVIKAFKKKGKERQELHVLLRQCNYNQDRADSNHVSCHGYSRGTPP